MKTYRRNNAVRLSKKGFTLVEVMIAMVIILLVLLGLVQATLLSIDVNIRNLLRDEAVRITEQRMSGGLVDNATPYGNVYEGLKNVPFDGYFNGSQPAYTKENWVPKQDNWWTTKDERLISRKFRSLTKDYRVFWRIRNLSANVKSLEVAVGWNHRNENPIQQQPTGREFQHIITSIIGNPYP